MTQDELIKALGWDVGGRMRAVSRDELLCVLRVVGATTHDSAQRLCPRCQMQRPGWPEKWKNCAVAPGVIYVCEACAKG